MDVQAAIEKAIEFAGSEAKLGQGTGFSQVAINKAKRRGSVSAEMALAFHRFTNGAVPGSALRPDLWKSPGDVPRAAPGTARPSRARAKTPKKRAA